MKRKLMKHKTLYKFIGQTVLYFAIFLALLYFFSYLGQGQGGFYLQRILEKETPSRVKPTNY